MYVCMYMYIHMYVYDEPGFCMRGAQKVVDKPSVAESFEKAFPRCWKRSASRER